MEALRIVLFQNSANYKKEETVDNKMTYPLPPFSTVIGALHNACGFREYHPMKLSIQGKYDSMIRKPYTDYCFLNSAQDDRGILVKMKNADLLSNAFDKVAKSQKDGSSYYLGKMIQVLKEDLLKEYRHLKDLGKKIKKLEDLIKKRKKSLANKKSCLEKSGLQFKKVLQREKEIKQWEKKLKDYKELYYKKPIAKFRTLITSLKYYEILTNVELIIHIKSDRETMECIKEHIYDLKSIGRSEDFVEVKEIKYVNLQESIPKEVLSRYSAYVDYNLVKEDDVISNVRSGISANGTKYYLNKNYNIINNKRIFEKKKVVYMSNFTVGSESRNVYLDYVNENKIYIVNFL